MTYTPPSRITVRAQPHLNLRQDPVVKPGNIVARTPEILDSARIPNLGGIPLGFFIAVLVAIVVWWLVRQTLNVSPWLEQRPAKGEPVTAGNSGNTNAPPAIGSL